MIDGCRSHLHVIMVMEMPSMVRLPLSIQRHLRLLEGCPGGDSTIEVYPDGDQGLAQKVEA